MSGISIKKAQDVGLSRAVVKVILREDALAKSHRPHYLLEQAGRNRVIGGMGIGELLVSVSQASINATLEAVLRNKTQNGEADLSTITEIAAIKPSDVRSNNKELKLFDKGAVITLFDYLNDETNNEAIQALLNNASSRKLDIVQNGFKRWLIKKVNAKDLTALSALPMVRELCPNTVLNTPEHAVAVGTKFVKVKPPEADRKYSVVGLLDSGICDAATELSPWLSDRTNFIQLNQVAMPGDYRHGTFIGGLLVQAQSMNGHHPDMPDEPVKIHDVRVYSKMERTTVTDVIARIDDAVRAAPHVHVWNLSLGETKPEPNVFSQFARDLDVISSKRGVLFIIAAGNCNNPVPLRPWPVGTWPSGVLDLITPPADSVLSLTVGSVAHNDDPQGGVANGMPAPYSRRGPGPAAIPKPELVHFGGNCKLDKKVGGGIHSLDPHGKQAECFGTSYAAPMVANMAARIWDVLAENGHEPTPAMVKAFLVHSAAIAPSSFDPEHLPFFGFGLPQGLDKSLLCTPDTFTTIHSVYIPKGQQIHHKFAMPACLVENDKFRGELVVTLCYAPILDERDGSEYCRSNVSVALGTADKDEKGVTRFKGRLPADPSAPEDALEKKLIEHGFKWSPLKVYRAQFPKGIASLPWQLRFDVLYRAGEKAPDEPQLAHAIVTVRGLEEGLPVYRDGLRALNKLGHQHSALVSPQKIRNR